MRKEVQIFLNGTRHEENQLTNDENIEWDDVNENQVLQEATEVETRNEFERLTDTCREIRAALRYSYVRMGLFERCQASTLTKVSIKSDEKTRFDSTVDMFESF